MDRSNTSKSVASASSSRGRGKKVTFSLCADKRAPMVSSHASVASVTTASSSSSSATAAGASTRGALTEMDPEDWRIISNLPGNSNCIDCNAKYPEWGSVNFGILFCTRCCSGHRALGTHISRVRSVRMDAWTFKQIKLMKAGGNQSCKDWFTRHGLHESLSHKLKYDNETAKHYTQVLEARAFGRREPVSLMEAERLKRWNKPQEWWRKWIDGEMIDKFNAASNIMKDRKNLQAQWQAITSSSDFWLVLYAMALLGWSAILFVFWSYG